MPASEVMSMLRQALEATSIGIPVVFLVLAVFYAVLKLLMSRAGNGQ